MKSQKGMALTSIIVYIIIMLVAMSIISIITSFFYNNVDETGKNVEPSQEYTRFNRFFTEDINKENAKISECSEAGDYIIFSDGTQYTFKNNNIYRGKVLICQNIAEVKFSYTSGEEENKDVINVTYKLTEDSEQKTSNFTLNN